MEARREKKTIGESNIFQQNVLTIAGDSINDGSINDAAAAAVAAAAFAVHFKITPLISYRKLITW